MADLKGLLSDPDFQKLDLATQKSTLGRLDKDFSTLSDADYTKFRDTLVARGAGPPSTSTDTRADWGTWSSKQHKSFAETFPKIGKYTKPVTDVLAKVSEYVPNADEAVGLGVPVEGVASGVAALGKRAVGVGASLLAGYGVRKGAKELGAPEILADALGGAAGVWLGGRISPEAAKQVENLYKDKGIGAVKNLLKNWLTPTEGVEGGFKVNKNILRKTASGGAAPVEYGEIGRPQRVGKPVVPEVSADTFKVNQNIRSKIASGGPAPKEYADIGRPERVGKAVTPNAPEPEPTIEPFKVNQNLLRKIKSGGPAPTSYGQKSYGKGVKQKTWSNLPSPETETFQEPPPSASEQDAQPAKKVGGPESEHAYPLEETGEGGAVPKERYQQAARTVKGRALARFLKIGGIPYDDAKNMTPEHWLQAAKGAGVTPPSRESIDVALRELQSKDPTIVFKPTPPP
jgi:hypothetical protein